MEAMQEQYVIDKQELEDEYEAISLQYEGFKFSVKNDSLLYKLENEQAKVRRLQEELRMTKATDQAEIKRLKEELSTLRKVLRSYIQQIDSLNRLNEELRAENKQISQKYQETSKTLNQVSQEKAKLSEKVSLAAQLVATKYQCKSGKRQRARAITPEQKYPVCGFLHHCPQHHRRARRTFYLRPHYDARRKCTFQKCIRYLSLRKRRDQILHETSCGIWRRGDPGHHVLGYRRVSDARHV